MTLRQENKAQQNYVDILWDIPSSANVMIKQGPLIQIIQQR